MTTKDRSSRATLKHLIDLCRHGEDAFRAAAVDADNPGLHLLFDFAADLQTEVRRLAEEIGAAAKRPDPRCLSPSWLKLL